MSPANALHLYRVRLRARLLPECFALVGIAAGVALLFAAQVSSSSLQSSVAQLTRGIAGRATLQLLARGAEGFPQRTLAQVRALPGVRAAAPLLEVSAQARGPRGSANVQLIGADESLAALGGALTHGVQLAPFAGVGAVVLPAPLARQLGVTRFGQEATFALAGRSATAPLYAQLHASQIGALINSPVAIVPLAFAQEISGLGARVSRIFVQPAPGSEARVRAGLQKLAAGGLNGEGSGGALNMQDGGGRVLSSKSGYAQGSGYELNVQGVGYDQTLFASAAAASNSATALFAAIGALVGFLLAFNATLLTVPQRRRLVAALRREGYSAATVTTLLALDALALGAAACVLGLALGEELSIHFLHANPAFLSLAFALGSQRAVSAQDIAVAVGGGMLAAFVAVLSPMRAARSPSVRALNANGRLTLAAALCLAGASAILLAAPQAPIPGMVLLVAALLLALGPALAATLELVARLARGVRGVTAHVAVMELRAARTRALAIAATGAVAVFGSVAIAGAHHDLLAGLDRTMRALNAPAAIWVAPTGSYDLMLTSPFVPTQRATLARLPGVRAVTLYRGGLLDYGARRVLVVAPPTALPPPDPTPGGGSAAAAGAESTTPGVGSSAPGTGLAVPAAGELTLSRALAAEHHLHVGQTFTLPSPRPQPLRIAALTDNLGWAPGAIVMNSADYARAWGSADASAYAVTLAPGAVAQRVAAAIERALGPSAAALSVETSARHTARQQALSASALARLTQIAALIPLVAVLAMAAALGAMIWQRRPHLAQLRLQGIARATLWRTLLLESVLLLGVGCGLGAAFGLYAQRLADSALAQVVNFPVAPATLAPADLATPAAVVLTALSILLLPGYLAARAPAALALATAD
jgi:putative ABC transport system permease protein